MDHLNNKLNKYLVKIITDYVFIDVDKLIKMTFENEYVKFELNDNITLYDIIVKSFNEVVLDFLFVNIIIHY